MDNLPLLYSNLADWWPILSHPDDYAEEAEFYRKAILDCSKETAKTMLELGSGGGNNASHLKAHFQMTLVDISDGMLTVSQKLNPECEHLQGDMRSVRLDRQFDVVFIHDAIAYLTTETDLFNAIKTAFNHTRPGGVALFAPDCVRETFKPTTGYGGHDGIGRSLRYLEWTWDPDPEDSTYLMQMVYLLREGQEIVDTISDQHELGLFSLDEWQQILRNAGFEPHIIPFEHSELEPESTYVFVGTKQ